MADATNGIAGHEGAGEVVAVHPDVQDLWQSWCQVGCEHVQEMRVLSQRNGRAAL
jgi:propanol-preferring alcohol dehydrogenase